MRTLALLIVLPGFIGACDDDSGGACEYETIDVTAQVVAIDSAFEQREDRVSTCPADVELGLALTDAASGAEVRYFGKNVALRRSASELDSLGLTVGSTHAVRYEKITRGSCTPDLFEFVDLEVSFDTETCVWAR